MRTLSQRQQRILEFLRNFLDEKGYPPSIREIQAACDVSSTSVVDYNLRILEREGHIRRDREVSRGIELADRHRSNLQRVPLLGQIAAGAPMPVPASDTWSNVASAENLELSRELTGGKENLFALRVRGTSMIDALIDDGDVVLIQQTTTAEDGEMVAAWLKSEQETTLKRLYRERDRVRLQPANPQFQPIYVSSDNVEVQGKVIAVIRSVQ
jgi:repressor LexA